MVDITYSQNIYQNQENLERIINSININNTDIVIDIGAGNGVITKELVKHSDNVIAYELDLQYFEILDYFKGNGIKYINRVKGYYTKHIKQHVKRGRVNRTRI